MDTKSERRERKTLARRKMRVTGSSVKLLHGLILAKAAALTAKRG